MLHNILPNNLMKSWGDSWMLQKMKCSLIWCPRDRTKGKPSSFTTFEAPYVCNNCNGCQISITEVDTCVSSPCMNGGTCVNTKESYRCDCKHGFQGQNCDTEINECLSSPCYEASTCVNKVFKYKVQATCGPTYHKHQLVIWKNKCFHVSFSLSWQLRIEIWGLLWYLWNVRQN